MARAVGIERGPTPKLKLKLTRTVVVGARPAAKNHEFESVGGPPEDLHRFMQGGTDAWGKLFRERGIRAN